MENLFTRKVPLYFETQESQLILGDSFKILTKLKPESVDMVFADPPYFLSNDGITCQGGRMVSVNKGSWDKLSESATGIADKHKFNRKWIGLCKKVLKPDGTIWISGTLHNIYSIGMALEQEGFKIINNITWQKTNPPPNLACRCFTHSTETILWAKKNEKKSRHFFNYQKMKEMNGGKQMKDVWMGPLTKPSEKTEGRHPTQKPEYLLERLDSNGRKNRGGHQMEDLVEKYIVAAGFEKNVNYFKEMYIKDIEEKWKIDLSALSNQGKAAKRFDFVIKTESMIYAIETNFYASGGSKLNETARSYKMLSQEADTIEGFTFVWFTDGIGWKSARGNLRETFEVMDTIYNIDDMEKGVMEECFL